MSRPVGFVENERHVADQLMSRLRHEQTNKLQKKGGGENIGHARVSAIPSIIEAGSTLTRLASTSSRLDTTLLVRFDI